MGIWSVTALKVRVMSAGPLGRNIQREAVGQDVQSSKVRYNIHFGILAARFSQTQHSKIQYEKKNCIQLRMGKGIENGIKV